MIAAVAIAPDTRRDARRSALLVFDLFRQVVNGLAVNPERALAEVRADYSTTTEIADALLQRANVPSFWPV